MKVAIVKIFINSCQLSFLAVSRTASGGLVSSAEPNYGQAAVPPRALRSYLLQPARLARWSFFREIPRFAYLAMLLRLPKFIAERHHFDRPGG